MHSDIQTFSDLGQKYTTWILKYLSPAEVEPLYLIWYTDVDELSTDRFMTFKTGDIFSTKSLKTIKESIKKQIDSLQEFHNLHPWLDSFNNLEIAEDAVFDMKSVLVSIERNDLDIQKIAALIDFINLVRDFSDQEEANNHLRSYTEEKVIEKIWDYYYDTIFWPRFNDAEKFKTWDRPSLLINTTRLLEKLKDMITVFEERITHTS
jgi:hypothetical protein